MIVPAQIRQLGARWATLKSGEKMYVADVDYEGKVSGMGHFSLYLVRDPGEIDGKWYSSSEIASLERKTKKDSYMKPVDLGVSSWAKMIKQVNEQIDKVCRCGHAIDLHNQSTGRCSWCKCTDIREVSGGLARKRGLTQDEVDPEEFKMGIEVEKEHTDDMARIKQTVLDHLAENPQYYTTLKQAGLEEQLIIGDEMKAVGELAKLTGKSWDDADSALSAFKSNAPFQVKKKFFDALKQKDYRKAAKVIKKSWLKESDFEEIPDDEWILAYRGRKPSFEGGPGSGVKGHKTNSLGLDPDLQKCVKNGKMQWKQAVPILKKKGQSDDQILSFLQASGMSRSRAMDLVDLYEVLDVGSKIRTNDGQEAVIVDWDDEKNLLVIKYNDGTFDKLRKSQVKILKDVFRGIDQPPDLAELVNDAEVHAKIDKLRAEIQRLQRVPTKDAYGVSKLIKKHQDEIKQLEKSLYDELPDEFFQKEVKTFKELIEEVPAGWTADQWKDAQRRGRRNQILRKIKKVFTPEETEVQTSQNVHWDPAKKMFSADISDLRLKSAPHDLYLKNPKTGNRVRFSITKIDRDEEDVYGYLYTSTDGKYKLFIVND